MAVLQAWNVACSSDDHEGACRAAITNMRGVKRFLARGRLEGPHTPPDASTAATWLKVCTCVSKLAVSVQLCPLSCLQHDPQLMLQSRVTKHSSSSSYTALCV